MPSESWKNLPKKLHTYGSWDFFFSAAPTAQNSPELHFRFINSPIQSSVLKYVVETKQPKRQDFQKSNVEKFILTYFQSKSILVSIIQNHFQNRVAHSFWFVCFVFFFLSHMWFILEMLINELSLRNWKAGKTKLCERGSWERATVLALAAHGWAK